MTYIYEINYSTIVKIIIQLINIRLEEKIRFSILLMEDGKQ